MSLVALVDVCVGSKLDALLVVVVGERDTQRFSS